LASRGSRFGALVIDLAIIGVLMVLTTIALIAIAGGTATLTDPARHGPAIMHALEFLAVVWIAAMFLFRNAYFLFFEMGPRGATPGKRITGIRIAARDADGTGGRLTAEMVIARNSSMSRATCCATLNCSCHWFSLPRPAMAVTQARRAWQRSPGS
jgi:uncharacterized RDD family membrane protein YckC